MGAPPRGRESDQRRPALTGTTDPETLDPGPGALAPDPVFPAPLVGSTLGFLFADLRGYTSFVEAKGAAAAAVLLDRYRKLVRGVVQETSGAEIRTEGDSFYVVFRSAGEAIRAGLAIVERADAANVARADASILVAVGIHAGETVETPEGYVGSAVNIAARVCAEAIAGEVLVSDTVRGLTRSVAPVQFVSRGHRRLKGVEDPVELFAVYPGDQAVPSGGKAAIELPYVGLRPFEEQDARFFIGRESDVEALLIRLARARFLAVFGPSGSGKSSLVRAGLVPALRRGGLPASATWQIEVIRPGAIPLETLAARIVRLRTGATMGPTVDELASDPRALGHAAEVILAEAPPSARLVWVVDQAEELFTLCPDEAARRAAIANLVRAAVVPGGRTVVVMAMRADFYHRCAHYPELAALVADSQYLASPLDAVALRRVIEEPAAAVGLELEPGLVDTILDDVADRPGALPLLEHALFELWDRRRGATLTLEGYRDSGGIDGAIAVRAESTYNELDPTEQAIARSIFLRLVQPGEGTEDTRRRAAVAELRGSPAADDTTQHVTEALAAARLLTFGTGEATGEPVVDIAHEALIRAWPRLRGWVDDDRDALRISRRISDAAAEWERLGRDPDALLRGARLAEALELSQGRGELLAEGEQEFVEACARERDRQARARERGQRLAIGLSVGAAAFFLVLGSFAWVQWTQSESARRDAVAARAEAEADRARAEERRVEALGRQLIAESLLNGDDLSLSTLLGLEGLARFELPEALENLAGALGRQPQTVAFRYVTDPVVGLAATPDGSRLAVISDASVPGADPAPELTVWDVAGWSIAHGPIDLRPDAGGDLAFSPAGDRLVFPAAEGLAVLDLASGHVEPVPGTSGANIDSAAWDGNLLRWVEHGAGDRLRLRTWDLAAATPSSIDLVSDALTSGARGAAVGSLLRDGRSVATVFDGGGVDLFAATTGEFRGTIPIDLVVGDSPDGAFLVGETLDADGSAVLQVYSLANLAPVGVPLRSSGATRADVGPGAYRVYVWSDVGTMTVFDVETGSQLLSSVPDPKPVTAAAIANETRNFIARGRELAVVDVTRDARLEVPGVGSGAYHDQDLISHGESIATSGDGATMAIWDFPQDGPQVVWSVSVMETATGKVLADVRPDEQSGIIAVALSDDGRSLATLHASGRLIETSIADGTQHLLGTLELGAVEGRVGILAASPDQAVALVEADRTRILRADGSVQALGVGGVAADFLPDGSGLAIADGDSGLVRIVGLSTADVATELKIDGRPMTVDVSGDGSRLLVGVLRPDGTGALELYALTGGTHLGAVAMTGPDSAIAVRLEARFEDAAGGTTAVSVTDRVRRWDVDPTSWKKKACGLAGRNLTRAEWARFLGDEPYRQTCPAYAAGAKGAAGIVGSSGPGP